MTGRGTILRALGIVMVALLFAVACGGEGTPAPVPVTSTLIPATTTTSVPPILATPEPQATATSVPPTAPPEPEIPRGEERCSKTLASDAGNYRRGAPERTVLREPEMVGTPLLLTGRVLTTSCKPIAGALLDFWHANNYGFYDNVGFNFRGKQYTDESGNYALDTIMPRSYSRFGRHIHVRVSAPHSTRVLTTTLYLDVTQPSDFVFTPLIVPVSDLPNGGKTVTFDFVLP